MIYIYIYKIIYMHDMYNMYNIYIYVFTIILKLNVNISMMFPFLCI